MEKTRRFLAYVVTGLVDVTRADLYRWILPTSRLLSISIFLSGCGVDRERSRPPESFIQRDSSAISIVENHTPAWDSLAAWTLEEDGGLPSEHRAGDPESLFYAVVGAVSMSDGGVVVANAGTNQLLWYDAHRRFIRAVGRGGEGPGEFQGMYGLFGCAADTLVVQEFGRVSFWDRDGEFVRTRSTAAGSTDEGSFRLAGVSTDCSSLLIQAQSSFGAPPAGEIHRPPLHLFWERLADGHRDTVVHSLPWGEFFGGPFEGLVVAKVRPWALFPVWTTLGRSVVVGLGDQSEIRVIGGDGQIERILRWTGDREPVSAEDRRLYGIARESFLDRRPASYGDVYVDLADAPVPRLKPLYAALVIDGDENLWVQGYPSRSAAGRLDLMWGNATAPESWMVFNQRGRLMGEVEVPAGHEVLEITNRHVITLWRDAQDVEEVRFLRIVK